MGHHWLEPVPDSRLDPAEILHSWTRSADSQDRRKEPQPWSQGKPGEQPGDHSGEWDCKCGQHNFWPADCVNCRTSRRIGEMGKDQPPLKDPSGKGKKKGGKTKPTEASGEKGGKASGPCRTLEFSFCSPSLLPPSVLLCFAMKMASGWKR